MDLISEKQIDLQRKIKKQIREIRKRRGESQDVFGAHLGLDRAVICNWELGRSEPKASQYLSILALDVRHVKVTEVKLEVPEWQI